MNFWWNLKICWENEQPSGQFSKWRSPTFPPKTLDTMKCLWLWKAFKTSFERRSLVISLWNSAICSENEGVKANLQKLPFYVLHFCICLYLKSHTRVCPLFQAHLDIWNEIISTMPQCRDLAELNAGKRRLSEIYFCDYSNRFLLMSECSHKLIACASTPLTTPFSGPPSPGHFDNYDSSPHINHGKQSRRWLTQSK